MGAKEYTLRISIYFFLLFTPFSSYMTILTHIYEEAKLPGIGPATLSCNYIAFIISTMVAPAIRLPLKLQLLIGGLAYTLNYSSGIFAAMVDASILKYLISCGGSIIAGMSAGNLWVSQGRYIHIACQKYGQSARKGEMYGIFSSLYCLSNVTAGLITTFGLGFFDSQTYFYIITLLGIISIIYCFFFVKHLKEGEPFIQEIDGQQSLISAPNDSLALINSKDEANQKKYSIKKSLKEVIHFFPVMFSVIPFLIIDGISLGIYSSQITHLIPKSIEKDFVNKFAGYCMISLGTGATIGGFLCGKWADKLGTISCGRAGLAFFLLGCGLFIAAVQLQNVVITLIAAFQWGFFLFFIQGWMYLVCSRHFEGRAQAFSVNKQLHSLFYLLFQLTLFYTDNTVPLLPLIGWLTIFAIPAVLLLDKIPHKTQSSLKIQK